MAFNSPCAACKIQGKECTRECIFAPYFPLDNLQRFECVNKVFGVRNVTDILNVVDVANRKGAVKTLVYEAEMRLQDPIYGCIGQILSLQNMITQLNNELYHLKKELATYNGPQASLSIMKTPPLNLSPLSPRVMGFSRHGQKQFSDGQAEHQEMVLTFNDDDDYDENKEGYDGVVKSHLGPGHR